MPHRIMPHRILVVMLGLFAALALATSASAITVNGVDYVLLAKRHLHMENSTSGGTRITGNVGVSDADDAHMHIGAHNSIEGTAIAHTIIFGSFSLTTTCRFDIRSGVVPNPPNSICKSVETPLPAGTLPLVAAWPPGPLGAVPIEPCVNTAPNFTVPIGATVPLPPGCYRDVRVNNGGTLNLESGNYIFRNLRLLHGSTLNGASQLVNVQNLTITEPNVTINDVAIHTPGTVGEEVQILHYSRLKDVQIYAPNATVHMHVGIIGVNVEVIADSIDIEPMTLTREENCGCFEDLAKSGTTIQITRGDRLNLVQTYFLATTCDVSACPNGTTCFEVPALPGGTATSATLDVHAVTAGAYHVIGRWASGTFCSADKIPIP